MTYKPNTQAKRLLKLRDSISDGSFAFISRSDTALTKSLNSLWTKGVDEYFNTRTGLNLPTCGQLRNSCKIVCLANNSLDGDFKECHRGVSKKTGGGIARDYAEILYTGAKGGPGAYSFYADCRLFVQPIKKRSRSNSTKYKHELLQLQAKNGKKVGMGWHNGVKPYLKMFIENEYEPQGNDIINQHCVDKIIHYVTGD